MTAASWLQASLCSVALPAAAAHQRGHVAAELGGVAAPGAAAVEVPVLPAQGRGQDRCVGALQQIHTILTVLTIHSHSSCVPPLNTVVYRKATSHSSSSKCIHVKIEEL